MDRVERLTLALIGGLLMWQLFVPPVTGLPAGGDYPKIIGVFDMGASETESRWAPTVYHFHPKFHWWAEYYSSEILLAGIAAAINWLFSKTPTFDLRVIGAVHGGMFFLALFLLLPLLRGLPARRRLGILAILAVISCDGFYALTFNSFYADAGACVFFVLMLVLFLRTLRWLSPLNFWAFVSCMVLFLTAKTHHAILGLPIAAAAGYSLARKAKAAWAGIAVVLAVSATAFSFSMVPASYRLMGLFNVIFWGLPPSSKNVPGDLAQMGLDHSYLRFVGTHAFTAGGGMGDPNFESAFGRRTSYLRLGRFYLAHPERAYRFVRAALGEGGRQQPGGGNFDPASGMPPNSEARSFVLWSGLKRLAFHHRGPVYLWSFLALSASFLYFAHRAGMIAVACGFVCIALLEVGVSTLADVLDPVRHLMLFNSIFDIMVLGTLVSLAATVGVPQRIVVKSNARASSVAG